jgi:transposase
MARRHWKFDEDFKPGAVPLVVETGTPIAQVARDLGVNDGTLGTGWPRPAGPATRRGRTGCC